jgi:hypothetical protein
MTNTTSTTARTLVGAAALLAAALLVAGVATLTYALTSEYGASPNDDLTTDLTSGMLNLAPAVLLVGALVWLGLAGAAPALDARTRARSAAAATLLTLAAGGMGTLLGHLALEARCAEQGASSSAACREVE